MTRTEHLLVVLIEECAEVSQRATKALRFGLTEVQPGQPHTNAGRLTGELNDLTGVLEMLEAERAIPSLSPLAIEAKKTKVERYIEYSRSLGLVETEKGGQE